MATDVSQWDEIVENAREGAAFSNSTSWEIWSSGWCNRCKVDADKMAEDGIGCALVMFAMSEQRTPGEWVPVPNTLQDYTCKEFVPEESP
jgi:hypothetical protein